MDRAKFNFAFIDIILFALAGWLIGTLIEHPLGPGGFLSKAKTPRVKGN